MSEPALKCENNAIFKQNCTLKLFITFKMPYYCCFSLGGNQFKSTYYNLQVLTTIYKLNLQALTTIYKLNLQVLLTIVPFFIGSASSLVTKLTQSPAEIWS